MKRFKQRIAVLLCILMTAPTIFSCLPVTALKAEAASSVDIFSPYGAIVREDYDIYDGYLIYHDIQVEEGETFEFGDLTVVYVNDTIKYFEDISGEVYTSSNKSVASISGKNGTVKAKKAGVTVLEVTYRGASFVCRMTVVKKGKLGASSKTCTSLGKKANAVTKAYGKGITSKNRYKMQRALNNFELEKNETFSVSYAGFKNVTDDYDNVFETNKLVVPEMLRANRLKEKMEVYVTDNNPIGTVQSKWFKISGVSGKANSNTVTVNLKKKVTATQIFTIKAAVNSDTFISAGKTAVFPIYLKDKAGHYYRGKAVATEGSKKIIVTMDYLRLKKGKKYQLAGAEYLGYNTYAKKSWTRQKSFTVK